MKLCRVGASVSIGAETIERLKRQKSRGLSSNESTTAASYGVLFMIRREIPTREKECGETVDFLSLTPITQALKLKLPCEGRPEQ
jgi:hypothetical protein